MGEKGRGRERRDRVGKGGRMGMEEGRGEERWKGENGGTPGKNYQIQHCLY